MVTSQGKGEQRRGWGHGWHCKEAEQRSEKPFSPTIKHLAITAECGRAHVGKHLKKKPFLFYVYVYTSVSQVLMPGPNFCNFLIDKILNILWFSKCFSDTVMPYKLGFKVSGPYQHMHYKYSPVKNILSLQVVLAGGWIWPTAYIL